jgi:predicted ATPase
VQDAAYDSLLKERRTQLHGKIAEVIEERWPHIAAIEPELLAQHTRRPNSPGKQSRFGRAVWRSSAWRLPKRLRI